MNLCETDGWCLRIDARYHDHEADPMFVSKPSQQTSIAESPAQRHRCVKAKEFGFELHMFSVITLIARFALPLSTNFALLQSDLLSLG